MKTIAAELRRHELTHNQIIVGFSRKEIFAMKTQSASQGTLQSPTLTAREQAVTNIWLRLSDQPLLRIGWIAMAGHQLFDSLGNVALSRIWVCHAPISARPAPDSPFGQTLAAIRRSGLPQPEQTITFDALLPGYQATVCKYLHACWQCLLVEDWAGQYIYLWANDTVRLPHPARLLPANPTSTC